MFSATNLVIRDGMGYVLDESAQQLGMILIPQELHQSVLFRKRSEFYNNIRQSPTDIIRELYGGDVGALGTNLQSSSLRVLSE